MLIKMIFTREDDSVVWTGLVDTNRPPADEYGREIPPLSIRLHGDQEEAVINGGLIPIVINEKFTFTIERDVAL